MQSTASWADALIFYTYRSDCIMPHSPFWLDLIKPSVDCIGDSVRRRGEKMAGCFHHQRTAQRAWAPIPKGSWQPHHPHFHSALSLATVDSKRSTSIVRLLGNFLFILASRKKNMEIEAEPIFSEKFCSCVHQSYRTGINFRGPESHKYRPWQVL